MRLQNERNPIYSVVFNPDGKQIVSAGWNDRTARVWDSSTGAELLTLRANCGAFSPDGKAIAGGTAGNSIVLWESAAPAGGYEPRKTAEAARRIVNELYEKHGFYSKVLEELETDNKLDESIRKVALQISNSRLLEDKEKIE